MLTIVKKNDSYDAITYQLENEDNSTVDLTGASVNFVMGKKNKLITNAKATVTSATSGIVSYQLTPLDTLVSGTFLAEFVVTFANGTVKTYPSNGYITVDVEQNLDTSQANVVVDMIAEKQGDFTSKLNSILLQAGNINMSAMNEYTWTANEGQLVFTFPSSSNYSNSTKWFQVSVGNVPVDNTLVNRSYANQFALNIDSSNIKAGMVVRAMWVEPIVPITGGHHSTHEINGQDEINIANLRNYQELVATPLADIATDVKTFGAVGDGITDDTLAIQAAISYVEGLGGGTVKFPKGTYWVKSDSTKATGNTGDGSSTPAGSCLVIRGSNITLLGAGKDKTKIICHSPSGQLNENSFAVIDFSHIGTNKVWRGGGIGIMGGTQTQPQQNITIRGIELDGTAHYTGNYNYPANTTTGDGWDITHRGIWLNPDTYLSNVMVDDCYIHSFKGELTYAAGTNITKLYLQNSTLEDSNAEANNFADGYIKNNIIGQMAIGFEPCPLSTMSLVIKDNKLNGPFAKGGISALMYDNVSGSSGSLVCESNEIHNAVTGILLQELRNTTIRNNTIIDSSTYDIRIVCNAGNQPKAFNNSIVENNTIIHKTVSITNSISILLDTYGASKTKVINNNVILSDQATAGVSINMPFSLDSGAFDNTCEVYGNHGRGTANRTIDSMVVKNVLVTSTFNFQLTQYNNPSMDKMYRVELTYDVQTACNVKFDVYYKTVNGAIITQTIYPSTAAAVGTYSLPSIIIHAKAAYPIQILCTPSVANSVHVSAKLTEV